MKTIWMLLLFALGVVILGLGLFIGNLFDHIYLRALMAVFSIGGTILMIGAMLKLLDNVLIGDNKDKK